jgi:hypothetical protein
MSVTAVMDAYRSASGANWTATKSPARAIQTLVQAWRRDAGVVQTPIALGPRSVGASPGANDIILTLWFTPLSEPNSTWIALLLYWNP